MLVVVHVRMIVVVFMGVAVSGSVSLAHDVVGKDVFYNSRIKTEADEVFKGGGIKCPIQTPNGPFLPSF